MESKSGCSCEQPGRIIHYIQVFRNPFEKFMNDIVKSIEYLVIEF